ncbi:MAG: hypothetical protein MJA84_08010 [Firmicutes bacterium]|nr:hypothetical protein [Bacillota bacterium]
MSGKPEQSSGAIKAPEVLQKKLQLFKEFYGLSNQLKQAIEKNDLADMEQLFEARQTLIGRIDNLAREDTDNKDGATNPPAEMLEIENEIKSCLESICAIDENIKGSLENGFKSVTESMGQLHTAWRTETTYRKKAPQTQGFFINKQR